MSDIDIFRQPSITNDGVISEYGIGEDTTPPNGNSTKSNSGKNKAKRSFLFHRFTNNLNLENIAEEESYELDISKLGGIRTSINEIEKQMLL